MHYLKIILFNIFIFFFYSAFASPTIICPTIAEIKSGNYVPWLPLYINGEELISAVDEELFKKHVTGFFVAKWDISYLENGHCFYKGDDPIVEKVIFAQDAWQPVTNDHWNWTIQKKLAECYSEQTDSCGFIT